MSQTHPNAYLADAAAKREQAKQLLQEADTLEARAIELGAVLPKKKDPKTADDSAPDTENDKPTGPEDATTDESEGAEEYSEDDPHRHGKKGRKH